MIECTMQITPRYIWKLANYISKTHRRLVIWRRICIIVSPLIAAYTFHRILIKTEAIWIFWLVFYLAVFIFSIWGVKIYLYIGSYRVHKKRNALYLTAHYCFTEDKIMITIKDITETLEWDKIEAFSSDDEYYYYSSNGKFGVIPKSGFNENDLEPFERLVQQKIARRK